MYFQFPNLPPDMFQQRVQAVLRQILTQQIMQQSEIQRRQVGHEISILSSELQIRGSIC